MRTVNRWGMLFVLASAFAYAETWTGKLVDADCVSKNANAACMPTASTKAFALEVSDPDRSYTFDQEGNKKAAEALKASQSGAERAKNPNEENSEITATVDGTLVGQRIDVTSITVH